MMAGPGGGGAGVREAGRRQRRGAGVEGRGGAESGRVPVVVLNACQSGAVGKDLEAAVATRLLREGCAAVVAMAYSVYAVAAAEFMAVFYERLFAGDTVSAAVTAGRQAAVRAGRAAQPEGGSAAGGLAGAGALPAPRCRLPPGPHQQPDGGAVAGRGPAE